MMARFELIKGGKFVGLIFLKLLFAKRAFSQHYSFSIYFNFVIVDQSILSFSCIK